MNKLIFCTLISFILYSCSTQKKEAAPEEIKTISKTSNIIKLDDSGCLKRDSKKCVLLGEAYHKAGAEDLASRYYSIACNLSNGFGCYQSAVIAINKENKTLALHLMEKSCTYKNGNGCFEMGKNREANNEIEEAASYYELSCRFALRDGCSKIGTIYLDHFDPKLSIPYFERACELGSAKDCLNSANTYYRNGSTQKAKEFFVKACTANHPQGCYNLSAILSQENDVDASYALLKKAIDMGYDNYQLMRVDESLSNLRKKYSVDELLIEKEKPSN